MLRKCAIPTIFTVMLGSVPTVFIHAQAHPSANPPAPGTYFNDNDLRDIKGGGAAASNGVTEQNVDQINVQNFAQQRQEMYANAKNYINLLKSPEGRKAYETFSKKLLALRNRQAVAAFNNNQKEIEQVDQELAQLFAEQKARLGQFELVQAYQKIPLAALQERTKEQEQAYERLNGTANGQGGRTSDDHALGRQQHVDANGNVIKNYGPNTFGHYTNSRNGGKIDLKPGKFDPQYASATFSPKFGMGHRGNEYMEVGPNNYGIAEGSFFNPNSNVVSTLENGVLVPKYHVVPNSQNMFEKPTIVPIEKVIPGFQPLDFYNFDPSYIPRNLAEPVIL